MHSVFCSSSSDSAGSSPVPPLESIKEKGDFEDIRKMYKFENIIE